MHKLQKRIEKAISLKGHCFSGSKSAGNFLFGVMDECIAAYLLASDPM